MDASDIKISLVPLDSLSEDDANANIGTPRGLDLLAASLSDFGFIEAGTLDAASAIMNGNKRKREALAQGSSSAYVIELPDSHTPIYLKYADFDLHSPDPEIAARSRLAAYALNRVAQVSINFSPAQIDADHKSGLDLSRLFDSAELAAYTQILIPPPSLEETEAQYGDTPADEAFWPILKLRLPPDTFLIYKQLLELLGAGNIAPPAARKGARGLKGAKRSDTESESGGLSEPEAFLALLLIARANLDGNTAKSGVEGDDDVTS